MLKVHFTRAKIFFSHQDGAERRYQTAPGVSNNVPEWVTTTLGWKMGVKDGSIVDLTPPKRVVEPEPEAETKPSAKELEDETGEDETGEDETGEDETGEDETGEDETGEDETEAPAAKPAKPAKKPRNTHGLQK